MTQQAEEIDEKNLISLEEAADLLETNKKEVHQLIDGGQLNAFRIGGEFVRLRKDQVSEIKARWRINRRLFAEPSEDQHLLNIDKPSLLDGIKDFFYFNDFYIGSFILIALFIFLIFSAQ